MQNSTKCKTRPNAKLARMQNSPEHKILPNEKFGEKATSECKTISNETSIKDDSHRKIQVLNFGGYYASYEKALLLPWTALERQLTCYYSLHEEHNYDKLSPLCFGSV